ncbi:hypothetical protein WN944_004120 [Citrus x changshan-huyou]|uniref:Uncharacterized protein n=1 Tax=Citrus x changshan-huyou TaxID=2935761 RepID=A0AAP0QIB0_9ROSI
MILIALVLVFDVVSYLSFRNIHSCYVCVRTYLDLACQQHVR